MPFIRITLFGSALSSEQIKRLQQGTTDLMITIMRKPVEGIAILVEQVAHGAWSIAGSQVDVAAQVEAAIGLDTNTPDEKARFCREMMGLLRTVLGPALRDETYITLREFDHDSYGRGGLTRAGRDRQRPAA
jgi:phenylpyruvate tautomerase PptA (4-oxalocrotonate tautomerase family)